MRLRHLVLLTALTAALSACRPDDQRTNTLDVDAAAQQRENWNSRAVAQLDSGSVAYRADAFEAALRHYRAVTDIDGSIAAGWFGVYMTNIALGDTVGAEAALQKARDQAPGATMIHEVAGDTVN